MIYKFICPKCGTAKEIEMKISEYTSKGHTCECGAELKRDVSDMSTNFQVNLTGFCGKCGS
jgi:predicted nucleic acid-binding Zn ribbon protein